MISNIINFINKLPLWVSAIFIFLIFINFFLIDRLHKIKHKRRGIVFATMPYIILACIPFGLLAACLELILRNHLGKPIALSVYAFLMLLVYVFARDNSKK